MPFQNVLHLSWAERHIPCPLTEASGRVDGLNPFVQCVALCLVLRAICAFDLKDQRDATLKADQEVGDISPPRTRPHVIDLEPEVIILGIGDHVIALFENVRSVTFP